MKAIVWQERYACNFRCPYCTIHSMQASPWQVGKEPTWQDWVEAFNKLRPSIMDITGGEPFLNKNLVDIINGLDCKIGLTTNLSQSILKFVQNVSPAKVISMTLSYHPSQSVLSREAFLGKAILLAKRGFSVNVNFVAYPEQLYLIPTMRNYFEAVGIRFHVDPFAEEQNNLFCYTEDEKRFLSMFVGQDRTFRIEKQEKVAVCSGGRDYLQVDPNGNAYRCMTHHLTGTNPIGNILDKAFELNKDNELCYTADLCGGCDRDKVEVSAPKVAAI